MQRLWVCVRVCVFSVGVCVLISKGYSWVCLHIYPGVCVCVYKYVYVVFLFANVCRYTVCECVCVCVRALMRISICVFIGTGCVCGYVSRVCGCLMCF